jgi:serine/threonine protein kinase
MKACPNCHATYPTDYTHCPRDGASLIEAGAWREGTMVRGKYRILAKVGQGGMATVYKAEHTRFKELRALKIMNAELAHDANFAKRFTREAILTRKLQHPNAVRVDDIDEAEDGRPFMVMEYIEGQSLKEVIQREAPMPVGRVCSIVIQVAAALEAAHQLGIVHRDIKPANIVLLAGTATGSANHLTAQSPDHPIAKVLDFGIAKTREARADQTQSLSTLTDTGHVIGTPAYMSPEQARGMKGDQLDGRSDLYSLGIVMYQMLAGGLPFKADTSMDWILAHIQTPPKPLWETRQGLELPPAVVSAVMRCLEKDRQARPESAAAFIEELTRAGQNVPSSELPDLPHLGGATAWSSPAVAARETSNLPIPRSQERRALPASPIREGALTRASAVGGPSRRGAWWLVVVAAGVLLPGTVIAWRVQRGAWPWPAIRSRSAAIGSIRPGASQAGAPAGTNGVSVSPTPDTRMVPDASGGVPPAGPAAAKAPVTPEALPSAAGAGTAGAGPSRADRPAAVVGEKAKRQADGVARDNEIADAVLKAEDDEKQGHFEEALKNYERASRLDPSDVRLKRDIQRLKDRLQREKELIQ